jgi:hypothetical protein
MNKELNLFRQLVVTVFEKHAGAYQNPSKTVQNILDAIPYQYSRFQDSSTLANYLPTDEEPTADFKDALKFMYLRPIEKGTSMVPVVSLKANFARSIPEVRIRLALFLLDAGHIRSIGYRFEAPEGPGTGRHDYYHVQPIHEVHRDKTGFALSTPSWLPVVHPAWPIDAKSPVSLVIGLLFSLYGLPFHNELVTYPMAGNLKTYLESTHYLNLPRPSFWQVQCGGKQFNYATRRSTPEFDKFCKKTHNPPYTKKPIGEAEYCAADEAKQLVS